MKFKLDENIGQRGQDILRAAGHDVATVFSQSVQSASDIQLIQLCHAEGRAIVSLDLDFANAMRFRPSEYSGIAVLRLPPRPSHDDLLHAVQTFAAGLNKEELFGKLWIIEAGRIRIYQEDKN